MICWVHGAYSTGRCFNYLRQFVEDKDALIYEYEVSVPLEHNISTLTRLLQTNHVDAIVGHSLGGMMAAIMVKRLAVSKGVAIASPLGGFMMANFMPLIRVLNDTASLSAIPREITTHTYDESFLSIVASKDGSFSDGVVPVKSQQGAQGSKIKMIDSNHFEVLLEPNVGELIQEHLNG